MVAASPCISAPQKEVVSVNDNGLLKEIKITKHFS